MATIKTYTDISQSKKLAKILPLESADMYYFRQIDDDYFPPNVESICPIPLFKDGREDFNYDTPCWSLAALLNYLREIDFFPEINADGLEVIMNINYYNEDEARPLAPIHNIKVKAESFIDACYEMILKLDKLNQL